VVACPPTKLVDTADPDLIFSKYEFVAFAKLFGVQVPVIVPYVLVRLAKACSVVCHTSCPPGNTGGMRAYVGVTDAQWYRQLADRPPGGQVKFSRPAGGRRFAAIAPGEPVFFETHHRHNRIVGGGLYSGFAALRIFNAWDLFGEANGTTISRSCAAGSPSTAPAGSRTATIRSSGAFSSEKPACSTQKTLVVRL